jgi:DNA-binding response OmpR family regulator
MSRQPEVLIVEDDEPTLALLAAIVARNALTAIRASDGHQCMILLAERPFAAMLLDLLLPRVQGIEILIHLGRTSPEMLSRVVIVTAAAESVWRNCREVQSVRALIRKPFDLRDVESALLACCARGHA